MSEIGSKFELNGRQYDNVNSALEAAKIAAEEGDLIIVAGSNCGSRFTIMKKTAFLLAFVPFMLLAQTEEVKQRTALFLQEQECQVQNQGTPTAPNLITGYWAKPNSSFHQYYQLKQLVNEVRAIVRPK